MVTNEQNSVKVGVTLDLSKFNKQLQAVKGKVREFSNTFSKIPFQAWALSIMFFGMAIKRVFDRIMKVGVNTFQEVMHSGEALTTTFDILTGVFKFLAFTIGDAINTVLEPFIPLITDIVLKIAEWISSNPRLVGTIIILGSAIGGLMMLIGILVLGIAGLLQGLGVIAGFLTGAVAIAFLKILAIVALVAIAFWTLWQTNLGKFKEFFTSTLGIVWTLITGTFADAIVLVSSLWKAMVALLSGDTDAFVKHVWTAIQAMSKIVVKIWMGMGAILVNVMSLTLNLLIDLFTKVFSGIATVIASLLIEGISLGAKGVVKIAEFMINRLIDKVNTLFKRIESASGGLVNLPRIREVSFSGIQGRIDNSKMDFLGSLQNNLALLQSIGDRFKTGFISGDTVRSGVEQVDKSIRIDKVVVENPENLSEMLEEVKRLVPTG